MVNLYDKDLPKPSPEVTLKQYIEPVKNGVIAAEKSRRATELHDLILHSGESFDSLKSSFSDISQNTPKNTRNYFDLARTKVLTVLAKNTANTKIYQDIAQQSAQEQLKPPSGEILNIIAEDLIRILITLVATDSPSITLDSKEHDGLRHLIVSFLKKDSEKFAKIVSLFTENFGKKTVLVTDVLSAEDWKSFINTVFFATEHFPLSEDDVVGARFERLKKWYFGKRSLLRGKKYLHTALLRQRNSIIKILQEKLGENIPTNADEVPFFSKSKRVDDADSAVLQQMSLLLQGQRSLSTSLRETDFGIAVFRRNYSDRMTNYFAVATNFDPEQVWIENSKTYEVQTLIQLNYAISQVFKGIDLETDVSERSQTSRIEPHLVFRNVFIREGYLANEYFLQVDKFKKLQAELESTLAQMIRNPEILSIETQLLALQRLLEGISQSLEVEAILRIEKEIQSQSTFEGINPQAFHAQRLREIISQNTSTLGNLRQIQSRINALSDQVEQNLNQIETINRETLEAMTEEKAEYHLSTASLAGLIRQIKEPDTPRRRLADDGELPDDDDASTVSQPPALKRKN